MPFYFIFLQLPLQDSCHIVCQTVRQIRPQQHTPLFLISAVDLSLRFRFYVDSNEPWLSPPTATVIHVFASFSAVGIKSSWWISTVWINQLSLYKSFWWNDKKQPFFWGRNHQIHCRTLLWLRSYFPFVLEVNTPPSDCTFTWEISKR